MKRLLFVVICVYAPHLLEEYFTQIWHDPFLAPALDTVANWSPQHAAYFVFQIMLVLLLVATLLFSLGKNSRHAVMLIFAVALLAESHHAIRFLISHHYNSGVVTSLPMPFVGAFVILQIFSRKENRSCSTTSFSQWESDESRSA
jgi:hypothetical protein